MNEGKQIPKNVASVSAGGIKPADIYYILFRRKWLVVGFLAVGLITGAVIYYSQQTVYSSEAKLLLRYVVDRRSVATGPSSETRDPGDAMINSEMEILTSLDLCKEVANNLGPERVLGKGGGSNVIAAAAVIRGGLVAGNPRNSTIIQVRFTHSDPEVCPLVLEKLVESYLTRHSLMHTLPKSYDEMLGTRKEQLLIQIRQSERNLRELRARAGVVSTEDARRSLSEQLSILLRELRTAEVLAKEFRMVIGSVSLSTNSQDGVDLGVPTEKLAEYKLVCARLETLRNEAFNLSFEATDENPRVKRLRAQIGVAEEKKKGLETEFPKLTALPVAQSPLNDTIAQYKGLESKIRRLTNEIAQVQSEATKLDDLEGLIGEEMRKLRLANENYMHVATGLEAAKFDEDLASVKANIQTVQAPSPPSPNMTQRLKRAGTAFAGILFAGIALAFLIELLLDRTVRRPDDFESKLQIPLFLSIPKLSLNGQAKVLPLPAPAAGAAADSSQTADDLHRTWDSEHALRRYIDGLRDQVLTYFEGDLHKPKLMAVTSCSGQAGVTSLAAGLAGALSETGDGNVLLLNLNFEAEAIHPFYRGELTCDLADALESGKRQNGMVLQNLYVATAASSDEAGANNLPKQLARVVPRLRVSDYDYIVFDMPPTTPTTLTARLAGMMDLVILVVESEKDTQETVRQAGRLLARSKARVSAVLNKVRNPVPRWLHREL